MPTYDSQYRKAKMTRKVAPRRPWRAYFYANGKRTYLGRFATKDEALAREHTEKLRRQRELLEDYPEEIKRTRQQNLLR